MKKILLALLAALLLLPATAKAHFAMVIPSESMVASQKESTIDFDLRFWHPSTNHGLNLAKPKAFYQVFDGKKQDIALTEAKINEFSTWKGSVKLTGPGVYAYVMEAQPYFEPSEDIFIKEIAKTYVAAFEDNADVWSKPVGLETEIVPLTRPYGLYPGAVFTGRLLIDGKPAKGQKICAQPVILQKAGFPKGMMESFYMVTDDQGLFHFTAPKPGWWGIVSITDSEEKIEHKGTPKNVELGAVIWLRYANSPGY